MKSSLFLLILIISSVLSEFNECLVTNNDLEVSLSNQFSFPFTPLWNQNYALCAGALAFNFDGITYANCRKKNGNSLGVTHSYQDGNVQTVNNIGNADENNNIFMVSTYSPPDHKKYAAYNCNSLGSYAQCNGGICFTSTSGKNFPGFGTLDKNEIICSCPIISSSNYHVMGPADCPTTKSEYDDICGQGTKNKIKADGLIIRIGSHGSASTTIGLNILYDKTFGTKSELKICEPIE